MSNGLAGIMEGFGRMVKQIATVDRKRLVIILLFVLIAIAEWKGTNILCAIAGANCQ